MALGLLDTVTVSLTGLVVIGMASGQMQLSASHDHTTWAPSERLRDVLLGLGHGEVVRVLRIRLLLRLPPALLRLCVPVGISELGG